MKKSIYIICSVLIGLNAFPQVADIKNYKETVIAPNLDATAIFKFTETAPDLSNGMINVAIPLYDIKLKELNIPINLKYYSRGIKVTEIASSVGLGWSLNYGGIVSRQVRDKADDSGMGYLNHTYYKDILNKEEFDVSALYSAYNLHDDFDLIPDRFFFSIADFSGEFIFDQKSGDILQQNSSDIKIKAKFNNNRIIIGWEIIDTKGNKYHFGIINNNAPIVSKKHMSSYIAFNPLYKYEKLPKSNSEFYDSWYLVKIETYYNEEVNYMYDVEMISYYSKSYDKKNTDSAKNYSHETFFSLITEHGYYLTEIKYPLGSLKFEKSFEKRKDVLSGTGPVNKVSNYSFKNELLSSYYLNFDNLFNDDLYLNNTYKLLSDLDRTSKYRMFLSKVEKRDSKDNLVERYSFKYDPQLLPNRFSNSKDVWGYYNGGQNGTFWDLGSTARNFEVNGVRSGAGLLKSIEYPTGKREEFTYEDNLIVNSNYGLIQTDRGNNSIEKKTIGFANKPLAAYDERNNCENVEDCKDLIGTYIEEFELPKPIVGTYRYSINPLVSADIGKITCNFTASLYKNERKINIYTGFEDANAIIYPTTSTNGKIVLKEGKYTLKVNGPGGCTYRMQRLASWALSLSWEVDNNSYRTEKIVLGEGKRIKNIDTYQGNDLIKNQEFDYITEDGKNSGQLFGTPPYIQKINTIGHLGLYVPFGLEDSSPLSSFRDNGLGYSNVIEHIKTKNQEKVGKINYSYTAFKNDGGGYYEWPFYLSINNEWKRGLLLSKKYYAYSNNAYQLQKKEVNTYEFKVPYTPVYDSYVRNSFIPAPDTTLPPFKVSDSYKKDKDAYMIPLIRFYINYYDNLIDDRFLVYNMPKVYYKRYYLTGGKYDLVKTEVIEYENGEAIATQTNNSYNSPNHRLLTSQRVTTMLGDSETIFTYVGDQTNSSIYSPMLTKNRIFPVVNINESYNKEKRYAIDYQYNNFSNTYTDVEKVFKTKANSSRESQQTILQRDVRNGHIIEIEDAGVKEVYLYGYNNTLLIAKIENASKEEVANALGVSVANLSTVDESRLSQINNLRTNTAFKEALITTYEHRPLVGVTKITDPKGGYQMYEYDSANRLKWIKDSKGNIIQENEYNYKNN